MISRLFKFSAVLAAVALAAGCKVAVINVEGGEVQSVSSGTCLAGTVCIHEVTDTNYSETFTAVPDAGWAFVKWNSGGNFVCQDSTDPACVVSNIDFAGNAIADAIIESDRAFYAMPVFRELPPPPSLVVADKEWAQVAEFTNLGSADIEAVCPGGACSGSLNGYDMAGWTWASSEDVRVLFNSYIGFEALPPDSGWLYNATNETWAPEFFADGWVATTSDVVPEGPFDPGVLDSINGIVLDANDAANYCSAILEDDRISGGPTTRIVIDLAFLSCSDSEIDPGPDWGAWFFRPVTP